MDILIWPGTIEGGGGDNSGGLRVRGWSGEIVLLPECWELGDDHLFLTLWSFPRRGDVENDATSTTLTTQGFQM